MSTEDRATFDDLRNAPTSLPTTSVAYSAAEVQRLLEEFSRVSEKRNSLEEEVRTLKSKARTTEILDQLIEPYAKRTYRFMVGYCSFVAIALSASAAKTPYFHIDNEVLTILVGSTAVTVIGLVGMVLTGVFVGARKQP